MHPILFRIPLPEFLGGGSLPLYSYGVMLGLSFIVGWYLTLGLAEREGLPRETMANCYVVTAISAVVASRLLYVVTNLDEFDSFAQIFEIRSGGMVAYGGFLGGFLGSWGYLQWKAAPTSGFSGTDRRSALIPWADVAVPSLASGLMITRIGCYLYGCDFGRPLAETAPALLKKLGTFPQWPAEQGAEGASVGSPAWFQHVQEGRIDVTAPASLPVHPTQIYESLVGATLLAFLLVARKHQKFRGQIFLYFAFFYGAARFALEFLRDDRQRGDIPPSLAPQVLFPLCLALFAAAYSYGIAPVIRNKSIRIATQVAAFVPAVMAFFAFRPEQFQVISDVKLSTSQFIGLSSGVAAAVAFGIFYKAALANPVAAMTLPAFAAEDKDLEEPEAAPAPKTKSVNEKTMARPKADPSEAPVVKKKKKKKPRADVAPVDKETAEDAAPEKKPADDGKKSEPEEP